jgi:hypothetical protein
VVSNNRSGFKVKVDPTLLPLVAVEVGRTKVVDGVEAPSQDGKEIRENPHLNITVG